MPEEEHNTHEGTQYQQVLPSGLAAEIASNPAAPQGDPAALGIWIAERLQAAAVPPERLAGLSGIAPADMTQFLQGRPPFPLDADHMQRLATALLELRVVTDPAPMWEAAGFAPSDYLVPPAQIVQSMTGAA